MKLLFDQNLSPRLVTRRADLFPDSNHVYPLGLDQLSDAEVRAYAHREGYLVVTKDVDFSDLCLLRGFPPKVIWIRRGNCSTAAIEQILRNHYDDIQALVADPALGVLALF